MCWAAGVVSSPFLPEPAYWRPVSSKRWPAAFF